MLSVLPLLWASDFSLPRHCSFSCASHPQVHPSQMSLLRFERDA